MDARSILGVPALRPAFLVDLPAAEPREAKTCDGAGIVRRPFRLDDDDLDNEDDEDDFENDDDESDDEEDEDDDEQETWQVLRPSEFR